MLRNTFYGANLKDSNLGQGAERSIKSNDIDHFMRCHIRREANITIDGTKRDNKIWLKIKLKRNLSK